MLKSKEIADFVPTDIRRLRFGEPIPGDLYLYFKSNSHIMLWQSAGTIFTPEMLEKYRKRGIEQIWVHKSDWEPFSKYLNRIEAVEASPAPARSQSPEEPGSWESPQKNTPPPPSELVYTTKISSRDIESILEDPAKTEREKRALAAKSSRTLLGELASPANLEEQDAVRNAVSQVVQDLVSRKTSADGACQQIWKVAAKTPELCHGVNVSTTAVLFALAFGRIEDDLLADIALAGLIHDLGMALLPYQLSQIPRESLSGEELQHYLSHTDMTPKLLKELAPEIPERAVLLASHHHEQYSKEANSPLSELSQLIAMADRVDSICTGQWDGQERTFSEALQRVEEMEARARTENRQPAFNPDVFAAVLRWIRSSIPEDALAEATKVVGQQMRSVS